MITVKDARGNSHQLDGRLETIVQAVIDNAGIIARPQNAQIIFDCAGFGKVDASIKHRLEVNRPEA